MIEIYTDGSGTTTDNPGGWAIIIVEDQQITTYFNGGELSTTNNRMELTAIFNALSYIAEHQLDNTVIFSDSQYCVKGVTEWLDKWKERGWKSSTGKVKNQDLWEKIDKVKEVLSKVNYHVMWVRGHDGNEYNELADKFANEARLEFLTGED